jgi:hypothetical protein
MINSELMLVPISAIVIRLFWVVIEYPYLRRYRVQPKKDWVEILRRPGTSPTSSNPSE